MHMGITQADNVRACFQGSNSYFLVLDVNLTVLVKYVNLPVSIETEDETEESCPDLKNLELKHNPVRGGVLLTGRVCVGV